MFVLDPFHDYAVVEAAPDVMQRIQLRDADKPIANADAGMPGRLIIPDSYALEGIGADKGTGKGKKGDVPVTTLLVGRVIWVGDGKWRDGAFVAPKCKRGDLVLFLPRTVSYEFTLHGRSIKILPYAEIVSGVRFVDESSAEWRELLAFLESAVIANEAQDAPRQAV